MRYAKASVFVASICLGAGVIFSNLGVAIAGLEPSPFQPEIKQLGAAENILVSANSRIVRAMDHPPDPCCPSPDLEGAVNRLGAINTQLISVDDMVASMIEEVMGFEPMPFHDLPDLVPALTGVKGAAQVIVNEIEARLGFEPMPFVPDFANSLRVVRNSAQTISTNAETYINQLAGCPVSCLEIETEADCESFICCNWIWTDNPDSQFGYCDIDPDYPPGM